MSGSKTRFLLPARYSDRPAAAAKEDPKLASDIFWLKLGSRQIRVWRWTTIVKRLLLPTASACSRWSPTVVSQQAQGQFAAAATMYRAMGMRYWLEKAEAQVA